MKNPNKECRWLQFCEMHQKKHVYHVRKCPVCKTYDCPLPVSKNVYHTIDTCDYCKEFKSYFGFNIGEFGDTQ